MDQKTAMAHRARKAAVSSPPTTSSLSSWLFIHQASVSFNLIALVFLTHFCFAEARPYTTKFFTLSGFNPATGKYAVSHDDAYWITFCIVLLTGIRATLMSYVLEPLSRYWGIAKPKMATRFAEQGWMLLYNCVSWSMGLYLYRTSPYYLSTRELWTDWPQRELDGIMKAYTLVQFSYWAQQILVVNMEEARKDYWQMIAHHVATISLVAAAYAYHFTRVGHVILFLMDAVELLFPLAKCLKYLGFTTICDVVFGMFMVTWLVTRHIFYLTICWSVVTETPATSCYTGATGDIQGPLPIPKGFSYLADPFRNPSGTVCWNSGIKLGFLTYLLALQVMMIMWSISIVHVALKVLRGESAEDVRSDDEDDEELDLEEPDYEERGVYMVEEEVGVEAIDFEAWKRRTGASNVREAAGSSSVSLPGHSDRKEFLNRIGCEKQID